MIRYVHGSEDSLDLDVYYVIEEIPNFKDCQAFCSADESENRNIIVIKDGIVVDCFKGTIDEINNGLIDTYDLHHQEHPLLVTRRVERDVLLKATRVMRCLLSYCSRTQYREDVKRALKSDSWKERIDVLKSIDFASIDDFGKSGSKEDVYKTFIFQIGQFAGLTIGKEYYTKSAIEAALPRLGEYLYRVPNQSPDGIVDSVNHFITLVSRYETELKDGVVYFKDFDKKFNLKTEKYV